MPSAADVTAAAAVTRPRRRRQRTKRSKSTTTERRHMTTQPTIDVRHLRKTYPGGVEAVKGIDFEVGAGEVFGLLGPNGAGKSTTIGMLTTTIAPTSGTRDARRLRRRARSARGARDRERRVPGGRRRRAASAAGEPRAPRPPVGRVAAQAQTRIAELVAAFGLGGAHRPADGQLQRRPAAAARDRAGARLAAAGAVPRRADGRPRLRGSATSCWT